MVDPVSVAATLMRQQCKCLSACGSLLSLRSWTNSMVRHWRYLSTPAEAQVLAQVSDLSIVSAFMQLAALQGEYAQLTGTLFAARCHPLSVVRVNNCDVCAAVEHCSTATWHTS